MPTTSLTGKRRAAPSFPGPQGHEGAPARPWARPPRGGGQGALAAAPEDPPAAARFTRWVVDRDGRRSCEASLRVAGVYCAACVGSVERALHNVDGVHSAVVNLASRRARVRWDPACTDSAALIAAIRRAGYDAVPDVAAAARELRRSESRTALWRAFVAAFCAMQVMTLAVPGYVAEPGAITPDLKRLFDWGGWLLTLPVLLFSAAPFFGGAWRSMRSRRIGMDVPVALGIAVTFVASTGAAFDPAGPFGDAVYFDSLTM